MHQASDQQRDVEAMHHVRCSAGLFDKNQKNEYERDVFGEICVRTYLPPETLIAAVAETHVLSAATENDAD